MLRYNSQWQFIFKPLQPQFYDKKYENCTTIVIMMHCKKQFSDKSNGAADLQRGSALIATSNYPKKNNSEKDKICIHYLLPEGRPLPYFHEPNVTGLNPLLLAVLWSVQCVYHTGTDSPLPGYNKDNAIISTFLEHLKYFTITINPVGIYIFKVNNRNTRIRQG